MSIIFIIFFSKFLKSLAYYIEVTTNYLDAFLLNRFVLINLWRYYSWKIFIKHLSFLFSYLFLRFPNFLRRLYLFSVKYFCFSKKCLVTCLKYKNFVKFEIFLFVIFPANNTHILFVEVLPSIFDVSCHFPCETMCIFDIWWDLRREQCRYLKYQKSIYIFL